MSYIFRICFNSISQNAYIDSIPLGRFTVIVDESERVIESTCYLESKKATENEYSRYVLIEKAIQNISKLTLTEKTYKEVNGRKVGAPVFMSIRNKAEMTVRYEAMKEELKELSDAGEQYVIVSQHKDASKRCAPLQGLLYKLDVDPNQDVKCVLSSKELGTRSPKQLGTVDGNPYYSLKEAMSYGLFSYNCRHRFIKYIPGSKVTSQYKYDEKAAEQKREIDKNMREMERQIRSLKERQVLALDSKERKFYQNASKQAQAKYKAYATKHGRDINLWRCSITKVERQHNEELYKENGGVAVIQSNESEKMRKSDAKNEIIEGLKNDCENFLNSGYSKSDLINLKLYTSLPDEKKEHYEKMFRSIVDDASANVNFNKNAKVYFGEGNSMLKRESSIQHILTDHFNQINDVYISLLTKALKENDFKFIFKTSKGLERYESVYNYTNSKGKIKKFVIYADRDDSDNLRIVTAFIK